MIWWCSTSQTVQLFGFRSPTNSVSWSRTALRLISLTTSRSVVRVLSAHAVSELPRSPCSEAMSSVRSIGNARLLFQTLKRRLIPGRAALRPSVT